MALCTTCKQDKPQDQMSAMANRCADCMTRRQAIAAGELEYAITDQVIELPTYILGGVRITLGFTTARCAHDVPVEWLCLHLHRTHDDARSCLDATRRETASPFQLR